MSIDSASDTDPLYIPDLECPSVHSKELPEETTARMKNRFIEFLMASSTGLFPIVPAESSIDAESINIAEEVLFQLPNTIVTLGDFKRYVVKRTYSELDSQIIEVTNDTSSTRILPVQFSHGVTGMTNLEGEYTMMKMCNHMFMKNPIGSPITSTLRDLQFSGFRWTSLGYGEERRNRFQIGQFLQTHGILTRRSFTSGLEVITPSPQAKNPSFQPTINGVPVDQPYKRRTS